MPIMVGNEPEAVSLLGGEGVVELKSLAWQEKNLPSPPLVIIFLSSPSDSQCLLRTKHTFEDMIEAHSL